MPLALLAMVHRLALLVPWHMVLIAGLLSVLAFAWSQLVRAPWLRAAALPGLAFGALCTGAVSLVAVPLAALALIGAGTRLTVHGDVGGALSLIVLAAMGLCPLLTLRAYWLQLHTLRASTGIGSSLALTVCAVFIAVGVWFGAQVTTQTLEAAMLERQWRPGGAWQRLFAFDAICESGCRSAFVRLYAATREDGRDAQALEQNFRLLFREDLPVVWEAERFAPWRWGETASR